VSETGKLNGAKGGAESLFDRIIGLKRITESLENLTGENLTGLLGALRRLVGYAAATVYLIDDKTKKLLPAAILRSQVEPVRGGVGDVTDPESWAAGADSPESSTLVPGSVFGASEGQAHAVTVPLRVQDRLMGLLALAFVSEVPPSREVVRLAEILGGQLAWSVERCQYRDKLTALYETLSKMETTQRLAGKREPVSRGLDEARDTLVSISHEVNNSLSVIIGNAQCLLLEKPGDNAQSQGRLGRIETAAVRIGEVNRRLLEVLAFSKSDDRSHHEPTVKL